MKIDKAEVFVTSPGRNFVTLRLTTSDGVVGIGDATLNGRELAVATYLEKHVVPLLVGRDANNIEDTWQYLYRGGYLRRGPVTMAAIAAVDVALWDIKSKVAGMPVYQLLGGASRIGALAYGHASGTDIPALFESIQKHLDEGYRAVRIQTGIPGLGQVYGVADGKSEGTRYDYGPAQRATVPTEEKWDTRAYLRHVPKIFEAVRAEFGPDLPLLHDGHHRMTPNQAAQLGKSLEPYDLFWLEDCTPAENQEALRRVRSQTTTPLAIGEIFNSVFDYQTLITEQLIDYVRSAVTRHYGAQEDHGLRGNLPGQVGLPRSDRHLAGRHGGRIAPRHFDPQLRDPGVHASLRRDSRGVPDQLHVRRRPAPPQRQAGTWRRARRGCRREVRVHAGIPSGQPSARRHGSRLVSRATQQDVSVVFLTGVSGSGKSTIGSALAAQLRWAFLDADDLHPQENIRKMAELLGRDGHISHERPDRGRRKGHADSEAALCWPSAAAALASSLT